MDRQKERTKSFNKTLDYYERLSEEEKRKHINIVTVKNIQYWVRADDAFIIEENQEDIFNFHSTKNLELFTGRRMTCSIFEDGELNEIDEIQKTILQNGGFYKGKGLKVLFFISRLEKKTNKVKT